MNLLELQRSPECFREALRIETDNATQPLGSVMDDWQRRDFIALDDGWKRVAGQPVDGDGKLRAWCERGRGHSKSSDAMVSACWALFASRKQIAGVVAAADRDQAKLDRDHLAKLVTLNPWLSKLLKVDTWKVTNTRTGSTLDIISSDVASSYGLLVDFAVCDEVTIWPKRDLFDSIFSAIAKRKNALLLCIGNAGFQDSWSWELREAIRHDPAWYFSRVDGCCASWIDRERLTEQERLLPPVAFERLWLNQWSTGGGDALSRADLEAAFNPELRPMPRSLPGWFYVAGLDLSVSRDASALVVLAVRKLQDSQHEGDFARIRLAHCELWRPDRGTKVPLPRIETTLRKLHERFDLQKVYADPYQAEHMIQRLGISKMPIEPLPQTGANLQRIATVMLEAFNDRRIELYDDADLKRDECNRRSAKSRKHGIFRHFGDFPSKKQKTCPCVTEHLAVLQDSGRVTKVSWVAGFA